jgi:membrane associated rhomboid family serine protease
LLVIVNLAAFALELNRGEAFVRRWAVIPEDIVAGSNWITILTAMFLHGSWLHLLGNMVFLWTFGPQVEDAMNPRRYLVFYLLGGLVASLAQVAVSPHSAVPVLGASGAIAAVMGAFLVTFPADRIRVILAIFVFVRVRLVPAALLIGVWFLIQLLNVGAVAEVETGGIAYTAHVVGLVFGALTARRFETPSAVERG